MLVSLCAYIIVSLIMKHNQNIGIAVRALKGYALVDVGEERPFLSLSSLWVHWDWDSVSDESLAILIMNNLLEKSRRYGHSVRTTFCAVCLIFPSVFGPLSKFQYSFYPLPLSTGTMPYQVHFPKYQKLSKWAHKNVELYSQYKHKK